jgi:hypothetical protein
MPEPRNKTCKIVGVTDVHEDFYFGLLTSCLPHTRRWIKSKTSPIALYNIHHRQNPFKSIQIYICFRLRNFISTI